jgi:putative mRNA 3-end processing factor
VALLEINPNGLYCGVGDFYVDPWQPVPRAIITHAHSDHARPGCQAYLASPNCAVLLRERLGCELPVEPLAFGESREINGVTVTLFPAGHVLGSAQVRIEYRGETEVVSGDYKLQHDPTAEAFEPIRCHTFITESTFGLPVYHWRQPDEIFEQINDWWRANSQIGRSSVLFSYALGKSQRILSSIDKTIGPILLHGAVYRMIAPYRSCGIELPEVRKADETVAKDERGRALILAPPSAANSPWLKKFQPYSTAFASGWMTIRGTRRRRAADRGFVISDHADWEGLLRVVRETSAEKVLVTHGYADSFSRYLRECGMNAEVLPTHYSVAGEDEPGMPGGAD